MSTSHKNTLSKGRVCLTPRNQAAKITEIILSNRQDLLLLLEMLRGGCLTGMKFFLLHTTTLSCPWLCLWGNAHIITRYCTRPPHTKVGILHSTEYLDSIAGPEYNTRPQEPLDHFSLNTAKVVPGAKIHVVGDFVDRNGRRSLRAPGSSYIGGGCLKLNSIFALMGHYASLNT